MRRITEMLRESANAYTIFTVDVPYGQYVVAAKDEREAENIVTRELREKVQAVTATEFMTDRPGLIGGAAE